jgi:hypothetical protein
MMGLTSPVVVIQIEKLYRLLIANVELVNTH